MRTSLTTETATTGNQLAQQLSEVILLREKVAEAELAARQIPTADKILAQHPDGGARADK